MFKLFVTNINSLSKRDIDAISNERKAKALMYSFKNDQLLSYAACIAFDKGLKTYNLYEKDVVIEYGNNGKPSLKDYPQIHFNISHSGELAIAAFSDSEIGCDIEQVRKLKESVLNSCFTNEEISYINNSEDKDFAFTEIWTLKESFLKCLGLGIAFKLNKFSVIKNGKIELMQSINEKAYKFVQERIDNYLIAICKEL